MFVRRKTRPHPPDVNQETVIQSLKTGMLNDIQPRLIVEAKIRVAVRGQIRRRYITDA